MGSVVTELTKREEEHQRRISTGGQEEERCWRKKNSWRPYFWPRASAKTLGHRHNTKTSETPLLRWRCPACARSQGLLRFKLSDSHLTDLVCNWETLWLPILQPLWTPWRPAIVYHSCYANSFRKNVTALAISRSTVRKTLRKHRCEHAIHVRHCFASALVLLSSTGKESSCRFWLVRKKLIAFKILFRERTCQSLENTLSFSAYPQCQLEQDKVKRT